MSLLWDNLNYWWDLEVPVPCQLPLQFCSSPEFSCYKPEVSSSFVLCGLDTSVGAPGDIFIGIPGGLPIISLWMELHVLVNDFSVHVIVDCGLAASVSLESVWMRMDYCGSIGCLSGFLGGMGRCLSLCIGIWQILSLWNILNLTDLLYFERMSQNGLCIITTQSP